MQVLAITGLPGSGKSVAADVATSLGWRVVRMGDCVWDEVRALGLELSEDNVAKVAREMRARHGPAIFAKLTLGRIRHLPDERWVVDGVRSPAEVDHFRKELGGRFMLCAIVAAQEARWMRIRARRRADETANRAAFAARDRREKEFGIDGAIAMAEVRIDNDADESELRGRVRALLQERER